MTKLIELTEENACESVRKVTTHLFEVDPPGMGEPYPTGHFVEQPHIGWIPWSVEGPADGSLQGFGFRFARAATPAEIASQAQPSEVVVARELIEEHIASLKEMRQAMVDYQMDFDEEPPFKHREMMRRAKEANQKLDAALSGKA